MVKTTKSTPDLELNLFQQRVKRRVQDLRLEPMRVAEDAGMERNFVRDIIIGKKKSVRSDGLHRLAAVLQCDPDYLTNPAVTSPSKHALMDRMEELLRRIPEENHSLAETILEDLTKVRSA